MTETTNHEAMQVIIRCDGCGAPMLTRFANGEFEFSLYYATLCRTRPLREGPEVSFPDGTKVTLREAPGFCSQPCFYPEETVRLGNAVREMRVARGYGLREAAKLLGCSAVDLSAVERGAAAFLDHEAAMAEIGLRLAEVRA